ncbi:hypothetical protein C8J56DRAFT_1058391 [Mycena floridula]|nr:hypothetical protein C8J56DRAFT_1058391 [Mycena floridula]
MGKTIVEQWLRNTGRHGLRSLNISTGLDWASLLGTIAIPSTFFNDRGFLLLPGSKSWTSRTSRMGFALEPFHALFFALRPLSGWCFSIQPSQPNVAKQIDGWGGLPTTPPRADFSFLLSSPSQDEDIGILNGSG